MVEFLAILWFIHNRNQSPFISHVSPFLTASGKIFHSRATFSKYLLLYIKPKNLELTVTIPSADVLIERCIKGDMSAYRLLYERYSKAMYNTALRISGNRADAEDILQDSFIDAFAQLRSFENKATFGAWLKQIVVFKSIALLKKRRLSFAELEKETEEQADEDAPDENEIEFTVQNIKKAMNQLPDGYRAVLSLYLLEGYDHEEIADIMRITQSTVRTQYKRGKQKLLQILKKEDVHE